MEENDSAFPRLRSRLQVDNIEIRLREDEKSVILKHNGVRS